MRYASLCVRMYYSYGEGDMRAYVLECIIFRKKERKINRRYILNHGMGGLEKEKYGEEIGEVYTYV